MADTTMLNLPVAVSVDGSEYAWIVQGGTDKRVTLGDIANTASGFVPTTREVNAGLGLVGGGPLSSDITLDFNSNNFDASTSMAIADSFVINDVTDGNIPRKITFPNAMKAIPGLTALGAPSLTQDFLIINHAADGLTYKISPSSLSLAAGNMPAGGNTGQILTKASNADYDTTWTSSGFVAEPANTVLAGPTTGPDDTPDFRLLVGADLPDPAPTTKGGVKSYAVVSNQFLTSIGTDGLPASAQPSFSNISGTASVSQGGTGATTFTAHGILIGEGTSPVVASAAMTDGQLLIGQTSADPLPKTVSGDVTISALGVTAIGANKVTNGILRQGAGLSVIGVTGSSTANEDDIVGIANQVLRVNGAGNALAFGSIDISQAATVGSSVLPVANGGTNIASYAVGDILYASGATTLATLADVATGNVLLSGGVTTAPAWGKVTPSHFSGTLPIANGGTGQTTANPAFNALAPTTTRGDLIYRNATVNARLAVGAANTVLRTDGTDPIWGAVNLATDTTGSLIVANGGTGASSFSVNGILYGNNTSPVQVTAAGTNGTVLSGNTGAAPTFKTVSDTLDAIGNTQGNILYRGASGWQPLAVGTTGQVLSTQGAGADPQWISAAGVGTVTSVAVSGGTTGLTTSGGPITAAGTITLAGTLAATNGGTGLTTYAQGDLIYASASTPTISRLAKDTNATRYLSNTGSSNNPAWAQVALTTGVSGVLPSANGGTGVNNTGKLTIGSDVTIISATDGFAAWSSGQIIGTNNPALGPAGTSTSLIFANATSGTVTLKPVTGALGSITTSIPAVTGTLVVGGLGATDNAALRADGTGTSTAQGSALIIADTTGSLSRSGNGGIPVQGTNTNDDAPAGYYGEYTTNNGAGVALTTGVVADAATISLTAGDWDVWGRCDTVASSSLTSIRLSTSATSATHSGSGGLMGPLAGVGGANLTITTGVGRYSLSGTTTIYLVTTQVFTGTNTTTATLYARRAR